MIAWEQRRGQIKHLLYEMCLIGRIDKATLAELFNDLNNVAPAVRCKDCIVQKICRFAQFLGNDGYCSQGERDDEVEECD